MDLQFIIVSSIILAALAYAGSMFYRKTRTFSKKRGCAADCGCSGSTKKLPS